MVSQAFPQDDRLSLRESVFVLCDLGRSDGRFLGQARVRNISSAGMMADVDGVVQPGEIVVVAFRNLPSVYATTSWVKKGQAGFVFQSPVDPRLLRRSLKAVPGGSAAPVTDVSAFGA